MGSKIPKIMQILTKAIYVLSLILLLTISHAKKPAIAFSSNPTEKIQGSLQTYIVHVENPEGRVPMQTEDFHRWYQSLLPETTSTSNLQPRMLYPYRNVITGFAAKLTANEAKTMEAKDGILLVRPEKVLSLHTTHSPNFLGLHQRMGLWKETNFGKGVIIGLLDTGIYPDHISFRDEGMSPPPPKWKGKCELKGASCNNKLIGARNFQASKGQSTYMMEEEEPFDEIGHGTHTSSIAGGNFVKGANVKGNANGTAAGLAPLAHLAMYKVCSDYGCAESDVLAALDAAIEDGVDVLSLSLGSSPTNSFLNDVVSLGTFSAVEKGIFVSCSAGNIGPFNGTVQNVAPWLLTVGASTTDRSIRATAWLGNGEEYGGESLYQPTSFSTNPLLPLVDPRKNGSESESSTPCSPGMLDGYNLKGKIVICHGGGGSEGIARGIEVKKAGASGMILINNEIDGSSITADAHVLPTTFVSYSDGMKIKAYMNSTSKPMAKLLFKGTVLGDQSAPLVTSTSSRGPSKASPGILKPDIIGPGSNILAAWPIPIEESKETIFTFNILSGTSLAAPHVSGIAALLKSSHPDWSPAAIKSAIMTTADVVNIGGHQILDQTLQPANVFATGSGHVNPSKANDPGLIYDINPGDYISYLCGLRYSDKEVELITHRRVRCSTVKSISEAELNYPSFSIQLGLNPVTVPRILTNVGHNSSCYTVEIVQPEGVTVAVKPGKIFFTELNQRATYWVTFSRANGSNGVGKLFSQGYLRWVHQHHSVRSPIAIIFE